MSTFPAMSMAVVKSHIWMLPLLWPLKRYRRGREPMRLEPSHSCTMKAVMEVPSTERTSHTLKTHTSQFQRDTKEISTLRVHSPLPIGRKPDIQFIRVWDNSLEEHLLIVSLSIRSCNTGIARVGRSYGKTNVPETRVTDLIPSAAASMSIHIIQAEDLEGAEGCGSRLGGDHPSKPGHRPRPHMVVVGTNWHT